MTDLPFLPPLPAATAKRPLRLLIADRNPCLLLSAVLMLLGCYLVSHALRHEDQSIKRIVLFGVMNLYECCIIPLGLILFRRTKGAARDGFWLLVFEAFFLVNATFINVDFGTGGWRYSFLFNTALFLLACLKAAWIFKGLALSFRPRTFGFFILQLALVYALPIFFAKTEVDGSVSPRILYACWWTVALLPLLYDLLAKLDPRPLNFSAPQNALRRAYLYIPWLFLIAHLGFAHWAHNSDFYLPTIAPALIGLALASKRIKTSPNITAIARLLPALAALLALNNPGPLLFTLHLPGATLGLGPALLTLFAAAVTTAYLASPIALLYTTATLLALTLLYLFAHPLAAATRRSASALTSLIPTTPLAWGITTITTAFLLLAAGAWTSLKRTTPTPPP